MNHFVIDGKVYKLNSMVIEEYSDKDGKEKVYHDDY